MLSAPNNDSPANVEAAKMMREDPDKCAPRRAEPRARERESPPCLAIGPETSGPETSPSGWGEGGGEGRRVDLRGSCTGPLPAAKVYLLRYALPAAA